jgi:hypothetical protein
MAKPVSLGSMAATLSGAVFFLVSIQQSALSPFHGMLFLGVKP